jgi:hypothetical protein
VWLKYLNERSRSIPLSMIMEIVVDLVYMSMCLETQEACFQNLLRISGGSFGNSVKVQTSSSCLKPWAWCLSSLEDYEARRAERRG